MSRLDDILGHNAATACRWIAASRPDESPVDGLAGAFAEAFRSGFLDKNAVTLRPKNEISPSPNTPLIQKVKDDGQMSWEV